MKISILLPDLRGGGAERLHLVLAREFVSRGHQVDFALMRNTGELLDEVLPETRIHDLKAPCFRNLLFPLMRFLKNERPDALLAAMWPLTSFAIWAVKLSGVPTRVVVSDHSILSLSPSAKGRLGTFPMQLTMRSSYRWADEIVGVSKGVAQDIARLARLDAEEINIIYNPAARGELTSEPTTDSGVSNWLNATQRLITVGKLKAVKDHVTLLNAFARIVVENDQASLLILGDGAMRSVLEQQVGELALVDRVSMPGYVQDPYPYYLAADLFVLTSEYEGFGNVIVEAMECGLPVIATDCPSGPREILDDGEYGKLVPVGDVNALAAAMLASLEDEPNPQRQKDRAADFSIEKAAVRYLQLLA